MFAVFFILLLLLWGADRMEMEKDVQLLTAVYIRLLGGGGEGEGCWELASWGGVEFTGRWSRFWNLGNIGSSTSMCVCVCVCIIRASMYVI